MSGVLELPTAAIRAFHDPSDAMRMEQLARSMRQDGWKGRPILVYKMPTYFQAITGSHRIGAARESGLDTLPCVVITDAVVGINGQRMRLCDCLAKCDNSPPLFATLCMFDAPPEVIGLMAVDFLARPEPDFDPEKYDWHSLGQWMLRLWHGDAPTLLLPRAEDLHRADA